jgi:hypothetical protein
LRAAVVAAEVLVGGLAPGVVAVEVGSPDPDVPVVGTVDVGVVAVGSVVTGVVAVGAVAVPVVVVTVVVPVVVVVVVVVVVDVVVPVPWPVPVVVDAEVVPAVNPPRGPRTVVPPGTGCSPWPDRSPVTVMLDVPAGVIAELGAKLCVAACVAVAAATSLVPGAEREGIGMLACAMRAAV